MYNMKREKAGPSYWLCLFCLLINNQQSPEVKNRAIFDFTKIAGDGKAL
jgi:hypothetical protein